MIYLDLGGRGPGLVGPEEAKLPWNDRGFLYGDGLFETVLLRSGKMPLLRYHLERLDRSAAALGISCDQGAVAAGALALAGAIGSEGEHALRITLSRGAAPGRGYQPPAEAAPTLIISAAPYQRPVGPLTAVTARSVRVNPESPLAQHKSLSALEKVLARGEAAAAGADEALLLNLTGEVAEGAAANLFLRLQGKLVTPPVSSGCLPGVMRRRVMELTGAMERPIRPEELGAAEVAWLSNALIGLLPLGSVDGQSLPVQEPPIDIDDLFTEVER